MKFEDLSLDPRILAGVKNAGFESPTPIQEEAIPHILEGLDVLGLAQTGTGKTAAFMLPILERLTSGPLRRIRALVVAPTRELAEQIHETAVELGKHTKIRSFPVYGGVSKGPQLNAIGRGTEIIVACPGRLLDHINEGKINLSGVEVLVLDEADRMCDMGFLPDIRRILKQLPRERQNLFFSATMPKDIRNLADEMLNDPVTVQIGMIAPAKTVSHALYPVPQSRKKGLLFSMLGQFDTDQVLIFTRTKRRARFLARDLEKQGYNVCALQGNMAQNRRQEAINGFRDGKYKILVATDIAARGIDVSQISHVINFDMPDTVDAYTHRIGRTGRAHATGEAYTFVDPADSGMVREIERLLGKKIERRTLEDFDYTAKDPRPGGRQPQRGGGGRGQNGGGRSNNGRSDNGRSNNGRSNSSRSNSSRSNNGRSGNENRQSGRGGRNDSGRNRSGEESQRRSRPDHMASSSESVQAAEARNSRGNGSRRANRSGGPNSENRSEGRRSDRRRSEGRRSSRDNNGSQSRNRPNAHRDRRRQADVSNLGPVAETVRRSNRANSAPSGEVDERRRDEEREQPTGYQPTADQGETSKQPGKKPRPKVKPSANSKTRIRLPKRNKTNKS